ncbi:MAG: T9SS type A sorting domain-containing protein [Nitritalea sp.]
MKVAAGSDILNNLTAGSLVENLLGVLGFLLNGSPVLSFQVINPSGTNGLYTTGNNLGGNPSNFRVLQSGNGDFHLGISPEFNYNGVIINNDVIGALLGLACASHNFSVFEAYRIGNLDLSSVANFTSFDGGGLNVIGSTRVNNINRAIDDNLNTFSSFPNNLLSFSVGQFIEQSFEWGMPAAENDLLRITFSNSGGLLNLQLLNSLELVTYFNGAETSRNSIGNLISVRLLDLGGDRGLVAANLGVPFDRVAVRASNVLNLGLLNGDLRIHDVRLDRAFIWTGDVDTDWFTDGNWSTGIVPFSNSRIIIPQRPNQPTIPADSSFTLTSVGELIMGTPENPNAILTVEGGFILEGGTVSVTQDAGSFIRIAPGANYQNLSTENPNLEVQQRIQGNRGWRMVGVPVTGASYAAFTDNMVTQGFPGSTFPSLQPNLLWFDETDIGTTNQAWRQPSQASAIVPGGRGHYLFVFGGATRPDAPSTPYPDALPRLMAVQGQEPNLSTPFSFPSLTFTQRDTLFVGTGPPDSLAVVEVNLADEGFNMVANPTASVLDWMGPGWTRTNLDGSIYVWDPTLTGGTPGVEGAFRVTNGSTGDFDGRLAPFQGFWVKANAANPSLSVSNAAKTAASASFIARQAFLGPERSDPVLVLEIRGAGMEGSTRLQFSPYGLIGADVWDAYQLQPLGSSWLVPYTRSSSRHLSPLAINHLPLAAREEGISIPLYLAAAREFQSFSGDFTFSWSLEGDWPEHLAVQLMDHAQRRAVNMRRQQNYGLRYRAPDLVQAAAERQAGGAWAALQLPTRPAMQASNAPQGAGPQVRLLREREVPVAPFTLRIGPVEEGDAGYQPRDFTLFAPFPNPFSDRLTVRFFQEEAGAVALELFGPAGQKLVAWEEDFAAGMHRLELPAEQWGAGMYVLRIRSGRHIETKKLWKK